MELRIETQKQTLTARDESIKKLLEMLQNKGMGKKFSNHKTTLISFCLIMFHLFRQRRRTTNVPTNASNGTKTGDFSFHFSKFS